MNNLLIRSKMWSGRQVIENSFQYVFVSHRAIIYSLNVHTTIHTCYRQLKIICDPLITVFSSVFSAVLVFSTCKALINLLEGAEQNKILKRCEKSESALASFLYK